MTTSPIKIDSIIRSSRRKTITLAITRDGRLIIRAPKNLSPYRLESIIQKRKFWIIDKQHLAKERWAQTKQKNFVEGEEFLFLGKNYPLSITETNAQPLIFDQKFYLAKNHLAQAKQCFIQWYACEIKKIIQGRLDWFTSQSGLCYNEFKITHARMRWGSCTPDNNLNFSWRLAMTPLCIIDYVVCHELMHIKERNHSQRFWNQLSLLFPPFKQCAHWLRTNEHLLRLDETETNT